MIILYSFISYIVTPLHCLFTTEIYTLYPNLITTKVNRLCTRDL